VAGLRRAGDERTGRAVDNMGVVGDSAGIDNGVKTSIAYRCWALHSPKCAGTECLDGQAENGGSERHDRSLEGETGNSTII
jgi:hypothetical protein